MRTTSKAADAPQRAWGGLTWRGPPPRCLVPQAWAPRGSWGAGSGGGDHGGDSACGTQSCRRRSPLPLSACGAPGPGRSLQAFCCIRVAAGLEDCGIMDLPWGAGL